MTLSGFELSREPIEIVEIDQDLCSLTYGVAPCTAVLGVTGEHKCFNTFTTCQDTPNFDLFVGSPDERNVLTLRFAKASSSLPRDVTLIPSVISIETQPTEINIGGGDKTLSPLGRRASVTITLRDHPHRDLIVDPYLDGRDYDPLELGTFWSKWLARNPYYENRALRVREGYVGQTLAEMDVRNYLIERVEGPSNGVVKIVAKDMLKRLDSDRSQAPAPSEGTVSVGFSAVAASFALAPAGIGTTYSTSGTARISGELFTFTRSSDTITFVSRGIRGTTAAAHTAEDTVQEVLVYTDAPVIDVIYELMTTYAGIDPSIIPLADWEAQADRWLGGFELTTWIAEPTGVAELISEIIEQSIIFLWWDEVAQQIKLQVLRPFDPFFSNEAVPIGDDNNIIAESVEIERKPEERISQVTVYYGQINPTAGITDPVNYARRLVQRNANAEADEQYGEPRVKEIFARWLGSASGGGALTIASRLLARYANGPVAVRFALDAKDTLDNGSVVSLTHHGLVDFTGAPQAANFQITSVNEKELGHRVEYTARPFIFESGYAFIVADDSPDYSAASPTQKLRGAWIGYNGSPDPDLFPDGGEPYRII